MVIYPDFRLEANNEDITGHLKKNLISIGLNDREGVISDELTFTVHGIYLRPRLGDTLRVELGTKGKLNDYGVFKVHATSINHKSEVTEVRASAVDFFGNVKERKSRLWEHISFAGLAGQIAREHGFKLEIYDADKINIISRAQNDMNDLYFLYTTATEYGFICAIKDNTLFLRPKGDADDVTVYNVDKYDCLSLQIDRAAKKEYGAVLLEWWDSNISDMQNVKVGDADPVYKVSDKNPKDHEDAFHMAKAIFNDLKQGTASGKLSIPGGACIRAGGRLKLTGSGEDDGIYTINSVSHKLGSGNYTIDIDFSAE